MRLFNRAAVDFVFVLILILMTACSSTTATQDQDMINGKGEVNEQEHATSDRADETDESDAVFPVTINLDQRQVKAASKPQRIVAISLDTADAVLELTDPSRVIAVADSIDNVHLAFQSKAGEQAANKLRFADSRDPEKILAYEPDLILLTKQHEGEMDAEQILLQSGIPLISFQLWNTIDEIAANIR
ncbi:hypothetical protein PRECH8_14430 [Insulibacter thermoxylanivorax]|uniref:Fe/B12 periplasmic-binding domain-containing protein n=2 Tax=Insulibacter thermoxylanivorax TaxID=2749268 RepID=A0A916QCD6_9BACL|nr:hypothetical protein PRECH8_14430 [Insulibacter thermoxylanivorax]